MAIKKSGPSSDGSLHYDGLSTFPDRRHLLQTLMRCTLPSMTARTFLILGDQDRLIFLFENVTICPKDLVFPQIKHFFAIVTPPAGLLQQTYTACPFAGQPQSL